MARKPRVLLKRRTREHVIADLSVHHVEGPVLRVGFTIERIVHDYGLDLRMMTYNARGEPEPDFVLFQLKATDHLQRTAGGATVVFRVETADILYWMRQTFPVILIVYDAVADVAYWLYVQAYFSRERDRLGKGRTLSVQIPTANVVNEEAIRHFAALKAAIQRQTAGARHHE